MSKRLYKVEDGKMVDGVCGGIGEYFNIDPTLVRIIWACCALTGTGIVAYFICALIMPPKSQVL